MLNTSNDLPQVIMVDIDGTICETDGLGYEFSRPIKQHIDAVNKLYDKGHRIIYWTARGAISKINWRELTEQQLRNWGCKYHELRLDKPAFDIMIDDKAIGSCVFFCDEFKK